LSEIPPLPAQMPDRRAPGLLNHLLDAQELWSYRLFRHLPIDWSRRAFQPRVEAAIRKDRPWVRERALYNLRRHWPEAGDQEIADGADAFVSSIAAQYSEYPTLGRIVRAGRVDIVGAENAVLARDETGAVALCLHTGNWEVLLEALHGLGVCVSTISLDGESRAQHTIISDVRRRMGANVLPAKLNSMREAIGLLQERRILAVFGDDSRQGRLTAPLFGREPLPSSNLALIAKLARKSGRPICVNYATRISDVRFRVTFGPQFFLPGDGRSVLDDVVFLNALIEPIILNHLTQWYMLDDEF